MSFNGRYDDLKFEMLNRGWTENVTGVFEKSEGLRLIRLDLAWEMFLSKVGLSGSLNFSQTGEKGLDTAILINNFRGVGAVRDLQTDAKVAGAAELFDDIARVFFSIDDLETVANPNEIHHFNIQLVRHVNHAITESISH